LRQSSDCIHSEGAEVRLEEALPPWACEYLGASVAFLDFACFTKAFLNTVFKLLHNLPVKNSSVI